MSGHQGPKAGSRAYDALRHLHAMGGRAERLSWFNSSKITESLTSFSTLVSGLITQGVVKMNANELLLTDQGREWLGEVTIMAPCAQQVVGPRYAPPQRELRPSLSPRAVSLRPGAQDFRQIPSRYGDERVAYGSGIRAVGDAQA